MKGCSRLNNFAAPSGQSSVQDLLKTRLIRSSHVNAQPNIALVRTLSMDVTAIIMPNSACAVTFLTTSNGTAPMKSLMQPLKDYTEKYLGLPDHVIRLEAFAGTTAGTDLVALKRVTADISLIVSAETLWIDVAVVDPGCQHYIQRYRSNEVPDAAAKAMETSKRNHYGTVKDPLPFPPASLSSILSPPLSSSLSSIATRQLRILTA